MRRQKERESSSNDLNKKRQRLLIESYLDIDKNKESERSERDNFTRKLIEKLKRELRDIKK